MAVAFPGDRVHLALRILELAAAIVEEGARGVHAGSDVGGQSRDGCGIEPHEQVRSEHLVVQRLGDPLHAGGGLRRLGARRGLLEDLAVEEERGDRQPPPLEVACGRGIVRPRSEARGEKREEGDSWKHSGPQKSQLRPPWKVTLLTTLALGVRSWLSALAAAPLMSLSFDPKEPAVHPGESPVADAPESWITSASAALHPFTRLT